MDHKEFSKRGGSAKSEKKTASCRENARKPRTKNYKATFKIFIRGKLYKEIENALRGKSADDVREYINSTDFIEDTKTMYPAKPSAIEIVSIVKI